MEKAIHIHTNRITQDRHIDISSSIKSEIILHVLFITMKTIACPCVIMEDRAKCLSELSTYIEIVLRMILISEELMNAMIISNKCL